ncbi:MAG TPA: hypothetical protein DCE83_13245, partial [Enterococcus sp.]|nr:hypothetical protein [Enterococcus sp.]
HPIISRKAIKFIHTFTGCLTNKKLIRNKNPRKIFNKPGSILKFKFSKIGVYFKTSKKISKKNKMI